MNYVILHYFFIVHLCNIKMSANTVRHKSNNYDIEAFIKQLLESRKFDELADKVADKAANAIKNIEKPSPPRLERLSDTNKPYTNETQNKLRKISNREYGQTKIHKKTVLRENHETSQNGHAGKINNQELMKEDTALQSNNLRLNYKYLTRNAYEKKVFNDRLSEVVDRNTDNVDRISANVDHKLDNADRDPILRNFDKNEDGSKQSVKQESVEEVQEHNSEHITEGQASHSYVTEKYQNSPKNEEGFEVPNRYVTRDNDREHDDSNKNTIKKINKQQNTHNDNGEGRHIESTRNVKHIYRDMPGPKHEQEHPKHSRDAHNPRPEFKSVAKPINMESKNTERRDEVNLTFYEDNQGKSDNPENVEHSLDNSNDSNRNEEPKNGDLPEPKLEQGQPKHSRDAHNSRPKFKSVAKPVTVELKNTERRDEENPTTFYEDNQEKPDNTDNVEPPIDKSNDREYVDQEAERTANEENVEEEAVGGPMFRGRDDDSNHETEENKVAPTDYMNSGSDTDSEDTTATSKKPIVRKEGNKLYTFVEAPEYEEYHEALARIKKEEGKDLLGAF